LPELPGGWWNYLEFLYGFWSVGFEATLNLHPLMKIYNAIEMARAIYELVSLYRDGYVTFADIRAIFGASLGEAFVGNIIWLMQNYHMFGDFRNLTREQARELGRRTAGAIREAATIVLVAYAGAKAVVKIASVIKAKIQAVTGNTLIHWERFLNTAHQGVTFQTAQVQHGGRLIYAFHFSFYKYGHYFAVSPPPNAIILTPSGLSQIIALNSGISAVSVVPYIGGIVGKYTLTVLPNVPMTAVPNLNFGDGWSMPRGGTTINGRWFTEHALERMAPDTPAVRAELYIRAMERAAVKGYIPGTREYINLINYHMQPRGIPPSVVEYVIRNTTPIPDGTEFIHRNNYLKVIVNGRGDVVSVHKIDGGN